MANALPLILLAGAAFLLMSKGGEDEGEGGANGDAGNGGDPVLFITDEEKATIREYVQNVKDTWDPINDITPLTLTFSAGATVHKFYPEWTTEAYQSGDAEAVEIWDGVTQIYTDVFGVTPQPLPSAPAGTDTTGPLGEQGPEIRAHVEGVKNDWSASVVQSPTNLSFSVMQTVQMFYPAWALETYWHGGKQKAWSVGIWDEIVKIYADVFGKAISPPPLVCNPTVTYRIGTPLLGSNHEHEWENFTLRPNDLKQIQAQGGDYKFTFKTTPDHIQGVQDDHHHTVTLTKANIDKLLDEGKLAGVRTSLGTYTSTETMSFGEVKELPHVHTGITIECHYGDAPVTPKMTFQATGTSGGGQV